MPLPTTSTASTGTSGAAQATGVPAPLPPPATNTSITAQPNGSGSTTDVSVGPFNADPSTSTPDLGPVLVERYSVPIGQFNTTRSRHSTLSSQPPTHAGIQRRQYPIGMNVQVVKSCLNCSDTTSGVTCATCAAPKNFFEVKADSSAPSSQSDSPFDLMIARFSDNSTPASSDSRVNQNKWAWEQTWSAKSEYVFENRTPILPQAQTAPARTLSLEDSIWELFKSDWNVISKQGSIRLCTASDYELTTWLMHLTEEQRYRLPRFLRMIKGYSLGGGGDSAYYMEDACISRIEKILESQFEQYNDVFKEISKEGGIRLDKASDAELVDWLSRLTPFQLKFLGQYFDYLIENNFSLGGGGDAAYYMTPEVKARVMPLSSNSSALDLSRISRIRSLAANSPIKTDNPLGAINFSGRPNLFNLHGGPCFDHFGNPIQWKKILVKIENYSGLPDNHPSFLAFMNATILNTNTILNKCCITVDVEVISHPGWQGTYVVSIDPGRTDGLPPRKELTIENATARTKRVINLDLPSNKGSVKSGSYRVFLMSGGIRWFPAWGGVSNENVGLSHFGIGNLSGSVVINFDIVPAIPRVHPGGNLAHEIGHDLGLRHPEEEPDKDPLANSDGKNFMHPGSKNPLDPVNDRITPRQCALMRLALP